jgi:hypothetical protein
MLNKLNSRNDKEEGMKSEIKHKDKKIQIKRIDETEGKETTTSSITITNDKIILEQNKYHHHS